MQATELTLRIVFSRAHIPNQHSPNILRGNESLEEKNTWFDKWMAGKMRGRYMRYYQEPVFLFDQ